MGETSVELGIKVLFAEYVALGPTGVTYTVEVPWDAIDEFVVLGNVGMAMELELVISGLAKELFVVGTKENDDPP